MQRRLLPPRTEAPCAPTVGAGDALAVGAFVAPPLAVFAPHGLAPLLAMVGLAALILDGRRCLRALRDTVGLVVLLAMLSLWCMSSATWSILPEHSLLVGLRFVLISVAGLLAFAAANSLEPHQRQRIRKAAIIGLIVAVALTLIERFSGAALTRLVVLSPNGTELSLTRFDRGAVVMVLSLWPALAGQRRVWPALVMTIAVVATVMMMLSGAAKLAMLVSLLTVGIAWGAPRLVATALGGGVVLLAIVLPLATPNFHSVIAIHEQAPWIKSSGIHRLLIWRFTADRIADRPILGWGMDASRELPGGHIDLGSALSTADLGRVEALPLHPHNAVLQWRVELGLPGTLLSLAILVWALRKVAWQEHLSTRHRAGALAWAAAACVVAMLSYGIWQEWWLSVLWLTSTFYAAAIVD